MSVAAMLGQMSVHLGTLPEWLAGLGTVAAFAGTLVVIRRDHRRRQEEHEERLWDRAVLVDGSVLPTSTLPDSEGNVQPIVRATAVNNGPRAILDVTMILTRQGDGGVEAGEHFDTIPAETQRWFQIPWRDELYLGFSAGGALARDWTVTFRDVAGRRWRRASDRSLTPEDAPSGASPSRSWARVIRRR